MIIRPLKYYEWRYEDGMVTLFNKKTKREFPIDMSKADSFCRACITFKDRYRIEQKNKLRVQLNKVRIQFKERIDKLNKRGDSL